MLKQIYFRNYKAFREEECLEIRPLTIIIGKNSSGKSSLCKLLPLLRMQHREIWIQFCC